MVPKNQPSCPYVRVGGSGKKAYSAKYVIQPSRADGESLHTSVNRDNGVVKYVVSKA
jgi:hypothetical protein